MPPVPKTVRMTCQAQHVLKQRQHVCAGCKSYSVQCKSDRYPKGLIADMRERHQAIHLTKETWLCLQGASSWPIRRTSRQH